MAGVNDLFDCFDDNPENENAIQFPNVVHLEDAM